MVYYRLDRNSHGPSHRPVLAVTLERIDSSAVIAKLGGSKESLRELGIRDDAPPVKALFTASMRFNNGTFDLPVDVNHACQYFFSVVQQQLNLAGEPSFIGKAADVFGHPETGMPAHKKAGGGRWGCLVFLVGLAGSVGGLAVLAGVFH